MPDMKPSERLARAERHLSNLRHHLDRHHAEGSGETDHVAGGLASLYDAAAHLLAELRQLRADVDSLRAE